MNDLSAATTLESFALSDIAHVEMGQAPDSRYVVEDPFQGRPFLQGNAEFGAIYPTARFGCLQPAKMCEVNDVLISVRAPVGAINLADRDYCIGRGLAAVRVRGMKPSLLGEVIARRAAVLRRVAQGTTFEAITKNDLMSLKVRLPPKAEWPKIAEILDTCDAVIQKTEALIDNLKALKQGLLHDLLTRGIDANGRLRPPQSEVPHLYKESPLGWVPVEWEVRPLSGFTASDVTYGIVQAGPHVPNGVPYIRTGDMSGDALDRKSMLCTSPRIARSYARSEVKSGEIVMAIRATVGKVLAVPDDLDGANLTQGTARISPSESVDKTFLLWAIRHARVQKAIQLEIKGSTFAEISLAALRKIPVAAPIDMSEQKEIAKRMEAMEEQLQGEHKYLGKLSSEKSALMDDLLTGRVRVTPLLKPTPT
jgi:type I restriction enzyme, S subunit